MSRGERQGESNFSFVVGWSWIGCSMKRGLEPELRGSGVASIASACVGMSLSLSLVWQVRLLMAGNPNSGVCVSVRS